MITTIILLVWFVLTGAFFFFIDGNTGNDTFRKSLVRSAAFFFYLALLSFLIYDIGCYVDWWSTIHFTIGEG